jgi:hypothetical protein
MTRARSRGGARRKFKSYEPIGHLTFPATDQPVVVTMPAGFALVNGARVRELLSTLTVLNDTDDYRVFVVTLPKAEANELSRFLFALPRYEGGGFCSPVQDRATDEVIVAEGLRMAAAYGRAIA